MHLRSNGYWSRIAAVWIGTLTLGAASALAQQQSPDAGVQQFATFFLARVDEVIQ